MYISWTTNMTTNFGGFKDITIL